MTGVLREKKVYIRPSTKRPRVDALTPEEQANTKKALRFLRSRHGGAPKLAKALGVLQSLIEKAVRTRKPPSLGLAFRAARLAGVPLEELLAGRWPPEGACPHCGRGPSEG